MAARVATDGLGCLGRATLKPVLAERETFDVAALNDVAPADNPASPLRYDTVHRWFDGDVTVANSALSPDGCTVRVLNEKDPERLSLRDPDVDLAFECMVGATAASPR
jgi:glyceraldehyde 3-phosphate dehydrogenase (phosphorylating)